MISKMRLSNNVFSPHHHRRNMNDKNYFNTKGNKQLELSSKRIVTKSITFNELCPIWSKKLSLGIDRVDKILVECDSKYTIVGEAWQFSGGIHDIT
jgi:hypothetical protein